jgi:HlyD family secretion protein
MVDSLGKDIPPNESVVSGLSPGTGRRGLWLLAMVAAISICLGGIMWWRAHSGVPSYVTAKVTLGEIQRTVGMTGSLNPVVTSQVGSYVSGNIKSWSCDYNTIVKVGQICATIDPVPFQVIVDQDQAEVHTAEAQLVKDRAALANAKRIYERDQKLINEGIISKGQIDTDKSTYDQDQAQIDLDTAMIDSKKASLHAAEVNLGYTNIVSPVDGMVITRYIDVGQTVVSSMQSSTLFLIGKDLTSMQVDSNVSEADIGDVKVGEKAYFTVQAYPKRTFEATVRQIREGPITVQNVVTYDVVLDVDNKDLSLFPGMTADAHIITAEHNDVLRVPLPATQFVPEGLTGRRSHGGKPAETSEHKDRKADGERHARLWLLVNGALKPIRVKTGLDDGTLIEVSSDDLKEGDEVVINAIVHETVRGDAGNGAPRQSGNNPSFQGGGGPRL